MGEEAKAAAAPAPKSGGGMKQVLVMLILVIVSAVGGMGLYKFVLAPRLEDKKTEEKHVEAEEESEAIPEGAIAFDFPEAQTAVVNNDPSAPNSVLIYTTSIVCGNEETKAIVEKNKQWFAAMLSDLHRNRTKEELTDPKIEKSILEEAREQANSLLRRLQTEPKPEVKVIQVLHLKFTVFTI
jgi:flagellar basal body-associated protein FliL